MKRRRENGMVLVACLLLLVLLSLLGASSLLSSSLNAQLVGNLARRGEAYYAAEAAVEVGVAHVLQGFRTNLRPFEPDAQWHDPDQAAGDPWTGAYNGYQVSYRISNAVDPALPTKVPIGMPYSTFDNGQLLSHYAYLYKIEGRASGLVGGQTITEVVRVLETPLVQYFVFYDDDLGFSPADMTCWGRVHTNGNLYVRAGPLRFRNYDLNGSQTPNQITVHGGIYSGSALAEGPRGTIITGASNDTAVRVTNWGVIPAPSSDYVAINTDITSANQGTQEARFKDGNNYYVKVGMPLMPSVSLARLAPGNYYWTEAGAPTRPDVDGIRILITGGNLRITLTLNGSSAIDVTDWVKNYKVSNAVGIDVSRWPADARTRAEPTSQANCVNTWGVAGQYPIVPGTIVYSPESIVSKDESNNAVLYAAARGAGSNPRYPCVLERDDPREVKPVDLTVIDLQRLELWYRDYLDFMDDGVVNGSNAVNQWAPAKRRLLIYVSRNGATPTTAGALQAVKLIGSRAGRTRGPSSNAAPSVPSIIPKNYRQSAETLVTNTTVVTDNLMYIDGDFNAPGASGASYGPGAYGCALLSDAVTLLSNNWGKFSYQKLNVAGAWGAAAGTYGSTGGTYVKPLAMEDVRLNLTTNPTATTPTTYNAAFISGRYDFTLGNVRSGNRGAVEASVHNFLRYIEDWDNNGVYEPTNDFNPYGTANMTGSLINLWFSAQANSDFVCCGTTTADVYDLPNRRYGWDTNFANVDYWPPYVPSIYSMERVSWQLQ